MTTEAACERTPELTFQGRIIVEWPGKDPSGHVIPAWKVSIFDAETGECINSASSMRINAEMNRWVVAELTQLIGMDGQPLRDEPADPVTGKVPPCVLNIGDDGKPKEAVFRYLVTEMRVRQ